MASLSHGYPAFQRDSLARAESDESTLPQPGSPVVSGSAEANASEADLTVLALSAPTTGLSRDVRCPC